MKKLLIISLLLLFGVAMRAQSDCILVIVHNIRSTKGVIRYALYGDQNEFVNYNDTFKNGVAEVKQGTVRFLICDIPDGNYGLCLLHDEDSNGDMNYSAIGIPKEGFGFSNDAKVTLSPPKYNACKFIKSGETGIRIKMRYML